MVVALTGKSIFLKPSVNVEGEALFNLATKRALNKKQKDK